MAAPGSAMAGNTMAFKPASKKAVAVRFNNWRIPASCSMKGWYQAGREGVLQNRLVSGCFKMTSVWRIASQLKSWAHCCAMREPAQTLRLKRARVKVDTQIHVGIFVSKFVSQSP